jgi:signal transduction histidine kinase
MKSLASSTYWQSSQTNEWSEWLNSQRGLYEAAGFYSLGFHFESTNEFTFEKLMASAEVEKLRQPINRMYRENEQLSLLQLFNNKPSFIVLTPIRDVEGQTIGSLIGIKLLDDQFLKNYQNITQIPLVIVNVNEIKSSSLDIEIDLEDYTSIEVAWPDSINSSIWTIYLLMAPESGMSSGFIYFIFGLIATLALTLIVWLQLQAMKKPSHELAESFNIVLPISEQINRLNRLKNETHSQEVKNSVTLIQERFEQLIEQKKSLGLEVRQLKDNEKQLMDTASHLSMERDSAVAAPRLKSEFLSRMGDEVTVPMNSVVNMLKLLSEYEHEDEAKELLNIAKRSTRTLVDNLNNILDFSKLDANLLKLNPSKFSVRELIDDLSSELAHFAHEKGLSLQASSDPEIPTQVHADIKRIRQIIRNLLGNAIRFTKKGEVSLYADMINKDDKKQLRFTVKDTGVGIPEDAQQELFNSLKPATRLTNSSFAGRLRLIVCKNLVDLMGGEIGLISHPGQGSQFWFTINIDE